jgi:DNA-binding IclR family transcriptional regulator
MRNTPRERVQSVERAVALLQLLAKEGPASLAALHQATGLSKTVVFRLLRTLEASGFVEQDDGNRRYQIGIGAFEVGQAYPASGPLIQVGLPVLDALVQGSPHTAYIGVRDGFEIVYLATVGSRGPLRVHTPPGTRIPAYSTAFGKVLLAELSEEEVLELARTHGLLALTPATITDPAALLKHLRKIRTAGYAVNDEEAHAGIGAIGAVIRDGRRVPVAAISLAYATSLMPRAEKPAWIERTKQAAADISARLERTVIDPAQALAGATSVPVADRTPAPRHAASKTSQASTRRTHAK